MVKKANDYPAIIAAFSTKVCCFFPFSCINDEKPGNRCANVIVSAQNDGIYRRFVAKSCSKKIAQEGKNIAAKKHRFALAKKQG
ncbi:hypothetical protein AB5T01_002074 [Escherichia albertii]